MNARLLALALGLLAAMGTASAATTEIDLPSGAKNPMAVGIDAEGDVWVSLDGAWGIVEINPTTLQARYVAIPVAKAGDSDSLFAVRVAGGAVWTATQKAAIRIDGANLSARSFPFPEATQLAGDVHVADGTAWTALVTEDKLVRINTTSGEISLQAIPTAPVGPLEFVDAGNVGVYFSATYGNTWGRLDPATGAVTLGPAQSVQAPTGIAWDGVALWLGEHGARSLVRVDPATNRVERFPTSPSPYYPISGPSGVVVARDGSIWFAEHFADRISRFDPRNRTLVEYEVASSPGANVQRVAEGKDGRIWFAEWSRDKIGHATYGGERPSFTIQDRIVVPAGATVRVPVTLPGTGVAGVGVDFLDAKIEGGQLVLSAAPGASPGEHNVLVGSTQAKTTVGRYVTVEIQAGSGQGGTDTPFLPAFAAAATLLVASLAARRRR